MLEQEQKIGVVVPSGDNIKPVVMGLFDRSGLEYDLVQNGSLHGEMTNFPATLTVQNGADVFRGVEQRTFGAGFIGSDRLAEYRAYRVKFNLPSRVEQRARFAVFENPELKLGILVRDNPEDNEIYRTVRELEGAKLLTTYPVLTEQFLRSFFPGVDPLPVEIDGQVTGKEEGQVKGGFVDAAAVIVDSGWTRDINMLRELDGGTIMRDIRLVMIYNPDYFQDIGRMRLLNKLVAMLQKGEKSWAASRATLPRSSNGSNNPQLVSSQASVL